MPKPTINASIDELRNQMARGLEHRGAPGSAGNIMPGPNALTGGGVRAPSGGGSAGLKGIPSRVGAPAPVKGRYAQITGSPAPGKALTPGSVPSSALGGATPTRESMLAHGRLLGAVKTVRAMHGDHPHLQGAHAKATAHIAAYRNQAKALPKGPKFGSLGGSAVPGAGAAAAGAKPLGMEEP